jgi:hypothetical protein
LTCVKKSGHLGYDNRMQKVKIMNKGNNNFICNIPDSSVLVCSNIQIIIYSSNKQIIVILELSKQGFVDIRVIEITEN